MHPAVSIIAFTTLSGAGLGLAALVGLGALADGGLVFGTVLALACAGGGLVCSIFHLRRPDRAWRALSQWRSSWLSREGILAPVALLLVAAYGGAGLIDVQPPGVLGWAAAAVALAAVGATGMIYAQLRAVPAWYGRLTVVCFLLFAVAGGAMLWACVATAAGGGHSVPAGAALLFSLAAWGAKIFWWRRLDRIGTGRSDAGTATGLEGSVRLLEPPHTGPNYLTREMVFVVARRRASALRRIALVAGCLLPAGLIALVLAAGAGTGVMVAAAGLHLAGVAIGRWLFFAEATHTVSLYYGEGAGGG